MIRIFLLCLSLSSCVFSSRDEMPAYKWAMKVGQGPRAKTGDVPIFMEARPASEPIAVAYCKLTAEFPYRNVKDQADWFQKICSAGLISADSIVYVPREDRSSGVVSTHIGYGVSIGNTISSPTAMAVCYRNLPFEIGFRFESATGLVVDVWQNAADVGMQVGDFVQAINGESLSTTRNGVPAAFWGLLDLLPGDHVVVDFIRPGSGKIRAKIQLRSSGSSPPTPIRAPAPAAG